MRWPCSLSEFSVLLGLIHVAAVETETGVGRGDYDVFTLLEVGAENCALKMGIDHSYSCQYSPIIGVLLMMYVFVLICALAFSRDALGSSKHNRRAVNTPTSQQLSTVFWP
jgi:hypothetical protein